MNKEWQIQVAGLEQPNNIAPFTHDSSNRALAFMLAELSPPTAPMVTGILYQKSDDTYQERSGAQIDQARAQSSRSLNDVLRDETIWTVD